MPESWKELEGQIIDGQFPLIQHLGGSDHSVVFQTLRKNSQDKAAIKFIPADPATADAQLSRWKSASQLSHSNLIKLYESGRCNLGGIDMLYVVMEQASENLADFLPHRALSPAETRDMLEPFVDALGYLHGKGFVHGKVRPGNILAIDDQLKLSSDSIGRSGQPRLGAVKADAYTAPESAQGNISEPADIWSLGITLVEALTQRVPDVAAAAPSGQTVAVPDTLPPPFLEIVRHSLQTSPQKRWTIADISQKLNPQAAPPQPAPGVSQSVPEAAKPATTPAAKSAPKDAAPPPTPPRKPADAVDPLSVPLSNVALDRQMIASRKSSGGYYLLAAIIVALIVGALYLVPRFLTSQSDSGTSASSSQPASPSTSPSPTNGAPNAPPPKIEPKRPTAQSSAPAERSAVDQPKVSKDAQQTAAAKATPPLQKESASSPSASPASIKSAVPRSDSHQPEAAPFVPDREASIKAGAVKPGEVLNQVLPEVPDKSRSTIHGTVRSVIKVHVDTDGNVSAAEIASGQSKFFSAAALDAAKRWDFAPAKVDGQAVPSEWLLHFDFTPTTTKVTPLATKP